MAENTDLPSTSIACGTYAIRPASRKKRIRASVMAATVIKLTASVAIHGEIRDPNATAITMMSEKKP